MSRSLFAFLVHTPAQIAAAMCLLFTKSTKTSKEEEGRRKKKEEEELEEERWVALFLTFSSFHQSVCRLPYGHVTHLSGDSMADMHVESQNKLHRLSS